MASAVVLPPASEYHGLQDSGYPFELFSNPRSTLGGSNAAREFFQFPEVDSLGLFPHLFNTAEQPWDSNYQDQVTASPSDLTSRYAFDRCNNSASPRLHQPQPIQFIAPSDAIREPRRLSPETPSASGSSSLSQSFSHVAPQRSSRSQSRPRSRQEPTPSASSRRVSKSSVGTVTKRASTSANPITPARREPISDAANDESWPAAPKTRRGRKPGTPDASDPARAAYLERNRKAAGRCRTKYKTWEKNLEARAREMQDRNTALKDELQFLKMEVLSLREGILTHVTCNDGRFKDYFDNEIEKLTHRREGESSGRRSSSSASPTKVG